jgi:hypothetical protein
MTSLLNQTEHLVDIGRPGVEDVGRIRLRLESDDTPRSVDSGINGLVSDKLTKRSLCRKRGEVEEFSQSGKCHSGVVCSNHSDVLDISLFLQDGKG